MGDIKFFQFTDSVQELSGVSMALEKELQTLIERNLETFLGIRFLASEYSTGAVHGGRIDTLGIDENGAPVIIEYKRAMNENVINQGLYYLDWLMDHRSDYKWLVMERYGKELADEIDWANPRLICIAGNFTRYDMHAVQQINRNIELYTYKHYESRFLMLHLENAVSGKTPITADDISRDQRPVRTVRTQINAAPQEVQNLLSTLQATIEAFGDDIQMKELKHYLAYKRIKNFACIEVHPSIKTIIIYVKADLQEVEINPSFMRDVTNIGHYGTGNLELKITNDEELKKSIPYIEKSYELN